MLPGTRIITALQCVSQNKESDLELCTFLGLLEHGRDWAAVSNVVGTKNETQCKNFFMNCKKQYNLEAAVEQHRLKTVRYFKWRILGRRLTIFIWL